jgi:PAS domain S-box-containing protein
MRGRGRRAHSWADPPGRGAFLPVPWVVVLVSALAVILVITGISYRAMRTASDGWEQLLRTEVADLVDAERLAAASELGARLTRDAVLTADPRAYRALGLNQAEVLDLLDRARARARTPEERALVETLERDHARIRTLGANLAYARIQGAPLEVIVGVLEREVGPLRIRIDENLARHARLHEESLEDGRRALDAQERRAVAALTVSAGTGVVVAVLLGLVLRRSLRALRQSEARFRATFEQAAVGIAHVSLEGRWVRLNRRYRELLGRDEDELGELTIRDVTHPEDRAADASQASRLLAGEIEGYALEERCVRKDGRVLWVNLTCALVRDRAGRPRYFVRAAEDISARKRVEQDLREAVRTRDEFLQIASHELRTPLAALRLQVESLRASLSRGPPDPARIAGKADAALRQTGRLGALVDGLLDVTRLGEGELVLEPAEVDVAQVARAAVERVAAGAARERTELRVHAPGPVFARVDRGRVEQAIGHLLSNALRYGVGKPVDVRVEPDGDVVRIAVEDRGIGIDPAEHERIFERFERAASWRHYGGLGLGLFLTKRIVDAHGGKIRAESAPGEGATLVVELPRDGPSTESAREGDQARATRVRGAEGDQPRA